MWNSHFLLDKLDKPIFHKNLNVFLLVYPYTHTGNILLINYTPYKNMFNGLYSAIFGTPLMAIVGKTNICWVLFSLTWKTFICPDTVFPPLLNKIPLVRLDVLIKIIQDFFKCYFKNAIRPTSPIFVTMQNWNWNLINCSCSNFACLNI